MDGIQSQLTSGVSDALRNSDSVKASRVRELAEGGQADKASKMFEELLATLLVREMRRGLSDGFFGGGAGADVYEGWLDQNVGRALSDTGALDLAQSIRIGIDNKASQTERREP